MPWVCPWLVYKVGGRQGGTQEEGAMAVQVGMARDREVVCALS